MPECSASRIFFHAASAQPGQSGYEERLKGITLAKRDPGFKKHIKKTEARGKALAIATQYDGPGLPADTYLRKFLLEYNGRVFSGQGIHQPSSWNILRAFVEPDEQAFVLKLLRESHFIIDLDSILDRITDPQSEIQWSDLLNLEDLCIYNMNIFGGPIPLNVDQKTLSLSSVSVVRDRDELSLMAVLGEKKGDRKEKLSMPFDKRRFGPASRS